MARFYTKPMSWRLDHKAFLPVLSNGITMQGDYLYGDWSTTFTFTYEDQPNVAAEILEVELANDTGTPLDGTLQGAASWVTTGQNGVVRYKLTVLVTG